MHITGKKGKKYTLSTACEDIIAHEKLTDEVIKFNDPKKNSKKCYVWLDKEIFH